MKTVWSASGKVPLFMMALVLSSVASAQEKNTMRKGFLDFNIGSMQPRGSAARTLRGTFGGGFVAGVRPVRFLQFESGVEFFGGVASIDRSITVTDGTSRRVRDSGVLVPVGGRLVLPLAKERILLSGGGGISYLRYYEHAIGQGNETVSCTSCRSRGGWGPYQVASAMFVLDRNRHFGLGMTARWAQVSTKGDSLRIGLGSKTDDQWFSLGGTFSLRF